MHEQAKAIEKGEKKIVGLNCFRMDHEPFDTPIFYPDPESTGQIQREKVERLKKERDNQRLEKVLGNLQKVTESGENVMPTVMEAVKAGATVGEICNIWRAIYGIWKIPFRG
jgi:methylmalonyl-CoA mutase N-terminal domain/subunit